LLVTTTTDADGYYFINYKHTGKEAPYHIRVTTPISGSTYYQNFTLKANGFVIVDFTNANPQFLGGWATPGAGVSQLTDADLQPVVSQAISWWASQGVDTSALQNANVSIADLPNDLLGQTFTGSNVVQIDVNAGGLGWWVDGTSDPIPGTVDLLTVVAHELGRVLGYDSKDGVDDVMSAYLGVGVRRLVFAQDLGITTPSTSTSDALVSRATLDSLFAQVAAPPMDDAFAALLFGEGNATPLATVTDDSGDRSEEEGVLVSPLAGDDDASLLFTSDDLLLSERKEETDALLTALFGDMQPWDALV
jgi:hypothetical protein